MKHQPPGTRRPIVRVRGIAPSLFTSPLPTNNKSTETTMFTFGKPTFTLDQKLDRLKETPPEITKQQTPLRENKEESICLNVAIEKKKNRVVFLECSNDFVDAVFSFLTLPIGRIVGILQGKPPDATIGCFHNLYQSVRLLDSKYFSTNACKEMLLQPGTSSGHICRKLKLKVDEILDANNFQFGTSEQSDDLQVFVKGGSQLFMITDDFQALVGSTSLSISLLTRLGINDPNELEIRNVVVNHDKLVQLLGLSFVSRSPLTHWILSEKDYPGLMEADDDLSSTSGTSDKHPGSKGSKIMNLVLYIRKSQNSVLYAECGADFVDCIFSFLAFPLGSILNILDCNSQLCSLDSLYGSVSNLASNGHFKSEEAKHFLLCPKLAPFYGSDNQLLNIEEDGLKYESFPHPGSNERKYPRMNAQSFCNPKSPTGGCKKGGTYLKGHAKFMVTDDLTITLLSPTGAITYLTKSNVPITDVDEVYIEFGVKEAKELLKAALTSKTALTDVFRHRHESNEGERLLHLEGLFLSEVD